MAETDDEGRMVTYGRAAAVAVVENEDGAHHVSAELCQAVDDVGFSLAPNAAPCWVGEAECDQFHCFCLKRRKRFKTTIDMMVRNTLHLANLISADPYPAKLEAAIDRRGGVSHGDSALHVLYARDVSCRLHASADFRFLHHPATEDDG